MPIVACVFHRLRYAGVLCKQRITGDSNEALAGVASLYCREGLPYVRLGGRVEQRGGWMATNSRIGDTCVTERKHHLKALLLRKQGFFAF